MSDYVERVYEHVVAKNEAQPEFHQAVKEVFEVSIGQPLRLDT